MKQLKCLFRAGIFFIRRVASESKKNLMAESNLGVVLGPTLMRPKEETMAAIMSIRFQSFVIETMIREYDQVKITVKKLNPT